ncbi:MAG TPA: hypothetical protein VGG39_31955 [Polyangiaceae bacterium]|jgi:DNA-directed RNA polymerase specialized sigma24 family protein
MDDARTLIGRDAKLRRGVLGYAYKVTRSPDRAQSLAQEAFVRVLEGKGWFAWDPAGDKPLFGHLCSVVDSLLANERARLSSRREIAPKDDEEPDKVDSSPNVEAQAEALDTHDEHMELARQVMERLDDQARRMLELVEADDDDPRPLAERLGCTPEELRRARERVAYHRNAVLEEHARKGRRS